MNYDSFRAGMLRAAEMARSEFKQAPEAARDHDCVYMSGYEDACDHLSVVIAQAAVVDSVRIAGSQPDWQYHISLLLPEGIEDAALLKIFQVVEHELRNAAPSDSSIRAAAAEIETRLGNLPLSLIDEIKERRKTLYKGFNYRFQSTTLKTDLDYALAFLDAILSKRLHPVNNLCFPQPCVHCNQIDCKCSEKGSEK